jgi:hypothetical protein
MDEDYEYDEGSDVDNWEDEQVFQDGCAENDFDEDDDYIFDEENEQERRAEYAAECSLGFGE